MVVIFDYEQHQWNYFPPHLAFSNQVHTFFFCGHSDYHKSHQVSYHSDEVAIFRKKRTAPEG